MPESSITFGIPFYSGIHFLPRALESILAQRDGNWRAFVSDDGSVDGVESLVRSYGDDRFRYHKNPRNLGMAGNWNRCLELADTDLVTLLHEDDELTPDYAAAMRSAAAEHADAAALYCGARVIDADGNPRFSFPDFIKNRFVSPVRDRAVVLEGEAGVASLLRGNHIFCPTLCFRRSRLGDLRFDARFRFVLDLELTTALLLRGDRIVGLPDVAYRYRRHGASVTDDLTRDLSRFAEESAYYDRMLALVRARGWRRAERLAAQKRIVKLNLGFNALSSLAHGRLAHAARTLRMIGQL